MISLYNIHDFKVDLASAMHKYLTGIPLSVRIQRQSKFNLALKEYGNLDCVGSSEYMKILNMIHKMGNEMIKPSAKSNIISFQEFKSKRQRSL